MTVANGQDITVITTFQWLSKGDLEGETYSERIAEQDRTLQTKYLTSKMLQTETDNKFKLCKQFDEVVEHVISVRQILAKQPNIARHDPVCAQLHFDTERKKG